MSGFAKVPHGLSADNVYTSITELKFALGPLKAQGVGLLTNHEGIYLGHPSLTPFFSALNDTQGSPHVAFVHPAIPYLRSADGSLIEANPSKPYPNGAWRCKR